MLLPDEWKNEPRDKRSPCPKCRGTQRRTAVPKAAPPPEPPGLLSRFAKMFRGGR
jgi:hypothetical protein